MKKTTLSLRILVMVSVSISFGTLVKAYCHSSSNPPVDGANLTIEGLVQNESGDPLPSIRISFSPRTPGVVGKVDAVSDSRGRFLARGLMNLAYSYWTNAESYIATVKSTTGLNRDYVLPGEKLTITLLKGGVVTGRILNLAGKPMPGALVEAVLVHPGRRTDIPRELAVYPAFADDRGIYRLYGLRDGSYRLYTTGLNFYYTLKREIPTFYPSSTETAASLVEVDVGAVTTGIDIIYKGETGNTISGTIQMEAGVFKKSVDVNLLVRVVAKATSRDVGNALPIRQGRRDFHTISVPDGEYIARAFAVATEGSYLVTVGASEEVEVSVKGSDVPNVILKMIPLGSAMGVISVEAATKETACTDATVDPLGRIILGAKMLGDAGKDANSQVLRLPPSADGKFRLYDLLNGRYSIDILLPDLSLYMKSFSQSVDGKQVSSGRIFDILPGRTLNLHLVAGTGAASIGGIVERAAADSTLYLVPEEKDKAADSARYYQSGITDSKFEVNHIAPGKYLMLVSANFNRDTALIDAEGRSKLLAEARKSGTAIELRPCQRLKAVKLGK